MLRIVPSKRNPYVTKGVYNATITVGTENANVVNVQIQLLGYDLKALSNRAGVFVYLSSDANGSDLIGTAHSGGAAIAGGNGLLIPLIANKAFQAISTATGLISINLTETGAKTAYLVVVLPDGQLVISSVITHTA